MFSVENIEANLEDLAKLIPSIRNRKGVWCYYKETAYGGPIWQKIGGSKAMAKWLEKKGSRWWLMAMGLE